MSKHKKNRVADPKTPFTAAPEKPFVAKSDFPEIENHLASDNGKTLGKAKKETSGIWVLIFLLGLLILLVVQHWLRQ
jgi:hypothetical protein